MAVRVRVGTSNVRLKSSVQNPSRTQTSTSIDGLQGVDLDGVQDGYTLVYDSDTGVWAAAPVSDVSANIRSIDGGTF
jgi:hypothetical protein